MKSVNIQSTNDINLECDWYEADSDKVIIMSHGFTGDRHNYGRFDKLASDFNKVGLNVLNLDTSGHGESDDAPIEFDQWEDDLVMAVSKVYEMGMKSIGLFGFSLGGLTALRVAAHAHAIVVMSPVTDALPDIIDGFSEEELSQLKDEGKFQHAVETDSRDFITVTQQTIDDFNNINQEELLLNIDVPVLIFHGDQDATVPIEHSRKAADFLIDAELEVLPGENHRLENTLDVISQKAIKFFITNL